MKQSEDRVSEKWQLLSNLYGEYARAAGLTSMSLLVLEIIYDNQDKCTQKLICEQSQFTKQSVNMIIKSFWKQGYVELVELSTDRRNKQVKLSERGMQYAGKIIGCLWKVDSDVMEKMTDEQRETLIIYAEIYEECIRNAISRITHIHQKNETGGAGADEK
ncbi:MarR family transcriptional regulator [Ruminococcus sp. OA3]|uniref:MarR family winged helix-turn-helix transcriptional regulator n=1 Tax=Ruminococcus sp. OA3 TaxID=2914164 RepID=UPI001F06BFAE|nr:helix-turn-helix domain-containing protein [Ruminococcus sp. OA3]MCH1982541.1 MarR family transcriptional regulator [Ruminococcus sp. OA3]